MGYFKSDDQLKTKKVTLPSNKEYWVEVKTEVYYGDTIKAGAIRQDGTPDLVASGTGMLQQMIVAWNLDDDAGNVLEVNKDNIYKLNQKDAMAIINALNDVEVETPAEKKSSTEPST